MIYYTFITHEISFHQIAAIFLCRCCGVSIGI